MRFLLLILLVGCQASIHVMREIPKTKVELIEYVASKEASIKGLEDELASAKESRDIVVESNKNVTGYFAKGDANSRISRANRDVEFITFRITNEKECLALAKARLENLKEAD